MTMTTATTAVTKRAKSDQLDSVFTTYRTELEKQAGGRINLASQLGAVRQLFANNEKLANCSIGSIVGSVFEATRLGLSLHPAIGQAYLVPYKTTCTLQIGVYGWKDLAMRHPDISSVQGVPVHEKDAFTFGRGVRGGVDVSEVSHVPARGERGPLTHVLSLARMKDGTVIWDVMDREDIEKRRDNNPAVAKGSDSPWDTWPVEMAIAKAVKTFCKRDLPKSVEVARALEADNRGDLGLSPVLDDAIDVSHFEVVTRNDLGEARKACQRAMLAAMSKTDEASLVFEELFHGRDSALLVECEDHELLRLATERFEALAS